jgi:acetyl-CoA carboxylase biotin carboxyl carrier protein
MEIAELRQLIQWLEEKGIETFELEGTERKLRLSLRRREAAGPISVTIESGDDTGTDNGVVVAAALAGTFLIQHPARSAPFVRLGGPVRGGDVIGLVQVGAVYAPVTAPSNGALVKILAVPESLIGFGTPLFEIHPMLDAA